MPGWKSFRDAPLEFEDQMRIMFDAILVTNETSYVPTSGGNDVEHGEDDTRDTSNGEIGGGTPQAPASEERRAEKRPAPLSPKGKKKKTFRDHCMKRLVDAYEAKAQSSSATSQVVDHVRDEIASMLNQVINDGAEEGSDEHFYATQLLQKKENRDVFITLKTPNGRMNWLRSDLALRSVP
ncbi:hypothetical protein EJB05_15641, partial [Eragrostis curvula]